MTPRTVDLEWGQAPNRPKITITQSGGGAIDASSDDVLELVETLKTLYDTVPFSVCWLKPVVPQPDTYTLAINLNDGRDWDQVLVLDDFNLLVYSFGAEGYRSDEIEAVQAVRAVMTRLVLNWTATEIKATW